MGATGLKLFVGAQEIIIYGLVTRNLSHDAYISILISRVIFWRENGRGNHMHPLWSGASKPDQKLADWMDILIWDEPSPP